VGIGGAPGESVWLKAGADNQEPVAALQGNDIRLSADKGNQSSGGSDAVIVSDVANGISCEDANREFVLLKRTARLPNPVMTDGTGTLWVFVGTDPGFEGQRRSTMRFFPSSLRFAASVLSVAVFLPPHALPQDETAVVVNSANFERGKALAPAMLATAFGMFPGVMEAAASGSSPTTLGNAQILVRGAPVPLLYVSERQINFIVPASIRPGLAQVTIMSGTSSVAGAMVQIDSASPAIFLRAFDVSQPGVILTSDFTLNSESNPAARGSVVGVTATGLGVQPRPQETGAMISLNRVDAASLSPLGVPGLWRIQIQVPEGGNFTGQIPLAIYTGGTASNTVSLWIR
jgi:uncharacterized protein (TIGR03437 family)